MHMQMGYRLAAMLAGVDHRSEAVVQALGSSKLPGYREQMAQQGRMFACGMGERLDVHAGDDKKVHGCLRRDIGKREELLILVER